MIVVLVGTSPYSFDRLVKAVDNLAADKGWKIFVQLGNTFYEPSFCLFKRFVDNEDLLAKITASDIVICHGGFGSIRDALFCGKPVVAVPRRPEFAEIPDEHQLELVQELDTKGLVLTVYDVEKLPEAIDIAKTFKPSEGVHSKIPRIIKNFLKDHSMESDVFRHPK